MFIQWWWILLLSINWSIVLLNLFLIRSYGHLFFQIIFLLEINFLNYKCILTILILCFNDLVNLLLIFSQGKNGWQNKGVHLEWLWYLIFKGWFNHEISLTFLILLLGLTHHEALEFQVVFATIGKCLRNESTSIYVRFFSVFFFVLINFE